MTTHLVPQKLRGVVEKFEFSTGLGVIVADNENRYPFHCIAIADGTREIEVDTRVSFEVFPALAGRVEAVSIEKL